MMRDDSELRDQLTEIERGLAVVPGPGMSLHRLVGPDRVEALDRLVSQDVKALAGGHGRLALLLAPKGQFRALMAVFGGPEELWLLAPAGRGEALTAALGRYLALSRSRLEPVAPGGAPVLLLGPRWTEAADAAGVPRELLVAGGTAAADAGQGTVRWFGQTLVGLTGVVAIASSDETAGGIELLARSLGACPAREEAVEIARIRVGFPAWGRELTDAVLPPEVGIEPLTISYSKGCYVGQETIARLRTYGHPNRRLVGVRQRDGSGAPCELPLPLTLPGEERPRGALTSLAHHPDLGGVGLALLRREVALAGTVLHGCDRSFEVGAFPLW